MVARERETEREKGESRSGLIVFSACVLAARNVDEEEYRVFAAKWLRSWQRGGKRTEFK